MMPLKLEGPFIMTQENQTQKYLFRLLAKRDYSIYRLKQKCKLKGLEREEYERTIQDFCDRGYINEFEYARSKVKSDLNRGVSVTRALAKLEQENILLSEQEISSITNELSYNKESQIDTLLEKKIRYLDVNEIKSDFESFQKLKAKLLRHLISKGHQYQDAQASINRYLK